MQITNRHGLPQSFLDFARNDKYSKGKADISVTTLIDSPRVRLMRDHFADLREVDVTDMIWPLFGTAVHHVLESGKPSDDVVVEERLFTKVNGWVLSGAVDHQKIDRNIVEITDYKVTSVWSVIHGKIDWERQLNVYAYLVQKNKGLRVKKLSICAVLRDWNKRDAAINQTTRKLPSSSWTSLCGARRSGSNTSIIVYGCTKRLWFATTLRLLSMIGLCRAPTTSVGRRKIAGP